MNNNKNENNNKESCETVRINKYIASQGICSRRQADKLIEDAKVKINGKTAVLGDVVGPNDEVKVNGKQLGQRDIPSVYIAFNKPKGIITTSAKDVHNNIIDYLDYPERIFAVGRLDKDSEGLIILTNDGDIVNKMMKSRSNKEKEYLVEVDKDITSEFQENMENGVRILNQKTKPAKFKYINKRQFRLTITQGLNRQIRRMCEALGYEVINLKRLRIMNIDLGNLKTGTWRYITHNELEQLKSLLDR